MTEEELLATWFYPPEALKSAQMSLNLKNPFFPKIGGAISDISNAYSMKPQVNEIVPHAYQ